MPLNKEITVDSTLLVNNLNGLSSNRSIVDPQLLLKSKLANTYSGFIFTKYTKPAKPKLISRPLYYKNAKIIYPSENIVSNKANEVFKNYSDGLFIALLGLIFMLVYSKNLYLKIIIQTYKATFNYQSAKKLIDEKSSISQKASAILLFMYLISMSVFIFLSIKILKVQITQVDGILLFACCAAVFFVYFFSKVLIYKILGALLNSKFEINEYLFNANIYHKAVGLLFIPIILFILFSTTQLSLIFWLIGLIIIVSAYILRIIRGFSLSFKFNLSLFYSFLYFCILELLPILYIFKIYKILA